MWTPVPTARHSGERATAPAVLIRAPVYALNSTVPRPTYIILHSATPRSPPTAFCWGCQDSRSGVSVGQWAWEAGALLVRTINQPGWRRECGKEGPLGHTRRHGGQIDINGTPPKPVCLVCSSRGVPPFEDMPAFHSSPLREVREPCRKPSLATLLRTRYQQLPPPSSSTPCSPIEDHQMGRRLRAAATTRQADHQQS